MEKTPLLHLQEIFFSRGNTEVLKNITIELFSHEIVALIGASGSGKTTLLKIITGLLEEKSGSIVKQGEIAYMDQEEVLLPWRTVYENITLPFEFKSKKNGFLKEKLKEFPLEDLYDKYPDGLSGGQKRIVSCTRTLLQDAKILLFDEPFSSIDVHIREVLRRPFLQLKEEGRALLFVTHDFRDAVRFADRVLFLKEGTIHREWSIQESIREELLEEISTTFCTGMVS